MFVLNLTKDELTFRAHSKVLKLKADGITVVDEATFGREELKNCFGKYIAILGEAPEEIKVADEVYEVVEEKAEEITVEEAKELEKDAIKLEEDKEPEEDLEGVVAELLEETKADEEAPAEEVKEEQPTKTEEAPAEEVKEKEDKEPEAEQPKEAKKATPKKTGKSNKKQAKK